MRVLPSTEFEAEFDVEHLPDYETESGHFSAHPGEKYEGR
jgi:hypothetical protein